VLAEIVFATEAGVPSGFDLIANFQETHSPVLAAAFHQFLQNPKLVLIGVRGAVLTDDPSLVPAIRKNYAALSSIIGWHDLLSDIRNRYVNISPRAILAISQAASDPAV